MAKGPNPITIVAAVIAVAAIGLSGFMFMKVNGMKQSINELTGDVPKGIAGEEDAGDGHGTDGTEAMSAAYQEEKSSVTYDLGEFTANTADGKYAVMDLTLVIESSYYRADFEQYEALTEVFNGQMDYYNKWNTGRIDKMSGEEQDAAAGDHAFIPSGVIKAAHSGPTELPAPERPIEPVRPMTALEHELAKNDSKVRDNIINQVNSHNAIDIIGPKGKPSFKKSLIDGLNSVLGDQHGEIVDLYFNQLIAN